MANRTSSQINKNAICGVLRPSASVVKPVVENAVAALWELPMTQYASSLMVGFSPNLWNSLSMIVLTSSALSGVVMMES
jgi:hypothetical protein